MAAQLLSFEWRLPNAKCISHYNVRDVFLGRHVIMCLHLRWLRFARPNYTLCNNANACGTMGALLLYMNIIRNRCLCCVWTDRAVLLFM